MFDVIIYFGAILLIRHKAKMISKDFETKEIVDKEDLKQMTNDDEDAEVIERENFLFLLLQSSFLSSPRSHIVVID